MGLRLRTLTLLAAAAAAGCGGHTKVSVRPVTVDGVRAFVVASPGRHAAGVVMVHGAGGDRSELLPRARLLARRGIVVLLPTQPSTASPPPRPTSVHELLVETQGVQNADVRSAERAGRFLAARYGVTRLGYLGWSAGAKTGAILAARDPRFRALALLSAGAQAVSAFVAAAPPASRGEVRRFLTSVDPITAIAHGRPGTILLEDGRRDEIVPRAALENVVRAAPPQTTVRWYDAGHALDDRAWSDAFDWLGARLR
ncbi:MAG TPA: dienelactone hydrolase family protein [Gaiellaceae bacterium]